MNLFERIFRTSKRSSEQSLNNQGTDDFNGIGIDNLIEIPEGLFIEKEAPEAEQTAGKMQGPDMLVFLKQDFRTVGYRDGYNYHSSEKMGQTLKSIKASFRLEMDQIIDLKKEALLALEEQKIEAAGLSEELAKKIDARIRHIDQLVVRLDKEKELSALDEGWIMKAIHAYRDGFITGTESYLEEKKLGVSTGWFN